MVDYFGLPTIRWNFEVDYSSIDPMCECWFLMPEKQAIQYFEVYPDYRIDKLIMIIEDFNRALEGLEIDADSFIVIFTPDHQYDRVILEQSLKTDAGYIGMISSRRKREAIYQALMAKGVKKEELDRVHSPIGLAIGGETPEEIVVSIVAELISVRASQ